VVEHLPSKDKTFSNSSENQSPMKIRAFKPQYHRKRKKKKKKGRGREGERNKERKKLLTTKVLRMLGTVVHTCNSSYSRLTLEDRKFKADLYDFVRFSSKVLT
jgi:hypothetical protein